MFIIFIVDICTFARRPIKKGNRINHHYKNRNIHNKSSLNKKSSNDFKSFSLLEMKQSKPTKKSEQSPPWEDIYYDKRLTKRNKYIEQTVNENAKSIQKVDTENLFTKSKISLYSAYKLFPKVEDDLEELN